MTAVDLNALLKIELGNLLYAEKVFLHGIKAMSKETTNPRIRDRIVQHAEETQEQIANLELAFESIGYKPRAQKSAAALGIEAERTAFRFDRNPSPEILQAFNLGAALRVEHFEIAAYRSAIALARQTGHSECTRLLQGNLDQEIAMATFLERNAPNALAQLADHMDEA
jgi:ferritin-like metal-binding protein YciE